MGVRELSEHFVERSAALDPVNATFEGIPGYDAELTDYSPEGTDERLLHARSVLRELDETRVDGDTERIAADVLRNYLDLSIDLWAHAEDLRPLRVISSPVS